MSYKSLFLSSKDMIDCAVISVKPLTDVQILAISASLTSSQAVATPWPFSVGSIENAIGKYTYTVVNSQGIYTPYTRILTKYGFNSRFTFEELVGIQETAKTEGPIAVLQMKFEIADEMDLDDPVISEGLDGLIAYGLLTAERKAEIMY